MYTVNKEIIGGFRTFGTLGTAYQIIEILENNSIEKCLLKIKVLETQEEAEYEYNKAINDPEAN
jgi:hypothetical protein